ncbi:hypothetical protein [Burkholderia ubonensis]|uniref:hypothetical protein n=1 Tax=Burkholderia ubonensis TaxID=101571 RepID=UPI000A9CEF20|nr:hypothetical protein [Burkholderia ubonensis]
MENTLIAIPYFLNNSQILFPFICLELDRIGDHGNRRVQDNRPTQSGLTLGAGAVHRPSPLNGRSLVAKTKRLSGGSPRNRSRMKHFQPVSFHYVTLLQRNEGFPAVGT